MAKDPAALLYIDTWLSSTAEMDADCRGWYLNLILHQYDKGSLPNDVELLAQLALVRYSEFERFKQVFEQVLKQKFKVCDDNRLRNDKADEVIRKRQKFTDKRSKNGSVGVVVKLAKSIGFNDVHIERLKEDLYSSKVDIEEAKDKQMLKQLLKLYRNGDEDVIKHVNSITNRGEKKFFDNDKLNDVFCRWLKMLHERGKPMTQSSIEQLQMKMNYQQDDISIKQIEQSLENGWLTLQPIEATQQAKPERQKRIPL